MSAPTYAVYDPATLELVGEAPQHTEEDVRQAIRHAQQASTSWAADRESRRAALRQIATLIRDDANRLGRLLSLEQGKVLAEAIGEFKTAADLFAYYADLEWDATETLPPRQGRTIEVQNRPVGIVGTITPWNFPISLLAVKLAPALVAGCTVIAKPSPTTPLSTIALVELMNQALPSGVLQTRTGSNRTVNVALSTLPEIRKISFTGSTDVGTAVAAQAAETVKRVTLELGGNDAALVLEDADIEHTSQGILNSAFRNAGQVCMAVKRVYVPRSIATELAEAMAAQTQEIVIGHGIAKETTMGPMHNESQLSTVRSLVDNAVSSGAQVITGGSSSSELPGYFMDPTLVINAHAEMPLVYEEQFGSALPIVIYDDLDTAVAEVNAGPYGLGASVWSQDLDRAKGLAGRLESGTVWINQHTVVELDAPFGGWKTSGLGRERGRWGLNEYLEPRTVNTFIGA
ncbi:aldehyde dehydrogenase family protein [Enteractinococcus helveticum]|uniref:Aldehyde dehydrogenase n=1 Tax=Enteractinococcus helveticum TaxID=1837282 RepID=A0A1B7M123_9MICC|nr:aldehyde dehydrogenase family protein [Enteractinococcus helveticum]OAV62098.1 aldehyde dehydrogenase [Enteractinococcus helveticum]